MANNILNPLEKELLIRLCRNSPDVKLSDFCLRERLARAEADAEIGRIGTSDALCFDAPVYIPAHKNSPSVYERDADSSSGVHHCHGEDGKSVYEA